MNGLYLVDLKQLTGIDRMDNTPLPVIDLRNNYLVAVNAGVYAPFADRVLLDKGVVAARDDRRVMHEYWVALEEDRLPSPLGEEFIQRLTSYWTKGGSTSP